MTNIFKPLSIGLSAAALLVGCVSSAPLVTVPVENVDSNPLKISALTESEEKSWNKLDLKRDTVPGMSVAKTYDELIRNKKGSKVIVAVIDSGVDINHEDLDSVIWTNRDEIPNNNIDDDKNGYIDDIHGWNFLGDVTDEQLEFVRIIARYDDQFKGQTITTVPATQKELYQTYLKAKTELDKKTQENLGRKTNYEQLLQGLKPAHALLTQKLGTPDYSQSDLGKIENPDAQTQQAITFVSQMFAYADNMPEFIEGLEEGVVYFTDQLNANLAVDKNFRAVLGDDPYDITDTVYGNNNVTGPDPDEAKHGTHVAGIIAAERNNGMGVDGVANDNIEIMVLRAVPNGDEYDKDIALAIRYAVDNGAKVINTSFGKYYAQNPEWVYEAIQYASKKDVLIINAAGNEGLSLDLPENTVYPNDQLDNTSEMADTFVTVGAIGPKYGGELLASFSNYGQSNVDVFAPGARIYSTTPNNEYEFLQGTSMAAPAVAGVVAMIRSYYPTLSATQVKNILLQSGLEITSTVIVGGDPEDKKSFALLSKSGKIVNMYNAFQQAALNVQ